MAYNWEVFISYNRQPPTHDWVKEFFYNKFKEWLDFELGIRNSRIFWDDHDVGVGTYWKGEILGALVTSKCILPIWTKAYFNSRWCVAEWRTFCDRERENEGAHLIVPILWQSGNFLPPDALKQKPADFEKYAITASAFLNSPLFIDYERELKGLCRTVAERIKAAPEFAENWPFVDPDKLELDDGDEPWGITLATP
jgi:hypothetical protein